MPLTATPMIAAAPSAGQNPRSRSAAQSAAVAAMMAMTMETPKSSGL